MLKKDYDTNQFLGEKIVFLQRSQHSLSGRWSLFVLENSSLPPLKKIVANMRKIKYTNGRGGKKRSLTGRVTGRSISRSFIINAVGGNGTTLQYER